MQNRPTQSLADFWTWLHGHLGCIIRAGTADAVLYDDEDLHWQLDRWQESYVVQLMRGKRTLGEFFILPEKVNYIEEEMLEGDHEPEYQFSLMGEYEGGPSYLFVLSHSSAEGQPSPGRRIH